MSRVLTSRAALGLVATAAALGLSACAGLPADVGAAAAAGADSAAPAARPAAAAVTSPSAGQPAAAPRRAVPKTAAAPARASRSTATSADSSAATAAVAGAKKVDVWAPEYMERSAKVSLARAVADATNFPILVATKQVYTPYVAQMKAVQPSLVVALYSNGSFARGKEVGSFSDAAFLKDKYGKRIKHRMFDLWLMNPASTEWINSRVALCRTGMVESNYNGCMLDNLGVAPLAPGYTSGQPMNPATGRTWTEAEWINANAALATRVRTGIAPAPLVGNSLGHGPTWFDPAAPSRLLMNGLDYGMVEGFMRTARVPAGDFPRLQAWQDNIRMMQDATARGKTLLLTTKVWVSASDAQKKQWLRFSLTSFLLGSDGKHRFAFTSDEAGSKTVYDPMMASAIGTPTSAAVALSNGTWVRQFTGGTVYVNPGSTTARPTSAGGVTVPPFDGLLVLK